MKNKELKTVWKFASLYWKGGFILWVLETVYFLISEGWHLRATSKSEIYLDSIVSNAWHIALTITVGIGILFIINLITKKTK